MNIDVDIDMDIDVDREHDINCQCKYKMNMVLDCPQRDIKVLDMIHEVLQYYSIHHFYMIIITREEL